MSRCDPFLYDTADPAAVIARKRDDEFFARHPGQVWRVRPLFEGESPMAEGVRGGGTGWRAYAIVIDHARAGDKRADAGRGIYPVVIHDEKHNARWYLSQEALRWVKWFRKFRTTPPPSRGTGVVMGGGRA